jgi:hypothetical protein
MVRFLRFISGLAVTAILITGSATAQEPVSEQRLAGIVDKSVNGYIRPAFGRFAETASNLHDRLQAYCEVPDEAGFKAVSDQFAAVVASWSAVEFLRFGPLVEDNRLERILFWPDRKGLGLKRLNAALAAQEEDVTGAADLADKSVAIQGLGTLEYLLYGTGSQALSDDTPAGRFRCGFAAAVSGNVASIAAQIRDDWNASEGFVGMLLNPSPDNPLFRSMSESAGEIHAAIPEGLDIAGDLKIKSALGDDPAHAVPHRITFWRSGLTFAALESNLQGMHDLLTAGGFLDDLSEENRYLENAVGFEFKNAGNALSSVPPDVDQAFVEAEPRSVLNYAVIAIDSLRDMIGNRLGAELGFQQGFSSLDGD